MLTKWLFNRYLTLFKTFPYGVFSLKDAYEILKEDKARIRVVLSELHRHGWIYRLKRGFYLVLSPYVMFIRGNWEKKKTKINSKNIWIIIICFIFIINMVFVKFSKKNFIIYFIFS